jgi:D-lyxose ketol-isomerase
MNQHQIDKALERAGELLATAGIVIADTERRSIEVTDFGLGRFGEMGLVILVYVNTDRVCAKELVMFPGQICPEHRHPPAGGEPGKEETFRCRMGEVYLYLPGEPTLSPGARVPEDKAASFTVRREVVLRPGDQYTLAPDTLHWFQAGESGAVVSEFSSTSRDELDIFTDPDIRRVAEE